MAGACGEHPARGICMIAEDLQFRHRAPRSGAADEPALVIDVEGFEGPLDLLAGALAC